MKLATWALSPLALGMGLLALGILLFAIGRRKAGYWSLGACFVWLWSWSSSWMYLLLGLPLENYCPPQSLADVPQADAIVVLGGGMASACPPATLSPELWSGADRGWQAAKLWKAGKAPVIIFSGVGEGPGMKEFLMDFGVPASAIILESDSRNTYENAEFTKRVLEERKAKKALLVTSCWHMKRSLAVFSRFGVETFPVGCDYECRMMQANTPLWSQRFWLPSPTNMDRNSAMLKEYIGAVAYAIYGKRD